jgi:hypothetical protein
MKGWNVASAILDDLVEQREPSNEAGTCVLLLLAIAEANIRQALVFMTFLRQAGGVVERLKAKFNSCLYIEAVAADKV